MTVHPLFRLAPPAGLPVTVFVLCYGPHFDLARRCLLSIYQHTPLDLFHLRVGLNEVVPETRQLVEDLASEYGNVTIFEERRNIFKNPMMRRMFTEIPLTNPWCVWFDDDSYVVRPDWLQRLALRITRDPSTSQWGRIYRLYRSDEAMRRFIRTSSWYRGLNLPTVIDENGCEGCEFTFVTGGFWAMRAGDLRLLDWPDPRLLRSDDDYLLGEAMRQNGLKFGEFDYGVRINQAARRNFANEPVVIG